MSLFGGVGNVFKTVGGSALGGLIGGTGLALGDSLINSWSAHEANRSAEAMSNKQMDFDSHQAERQMAFQERMANSAFQRARADMTAAGFNPLLALPSGADSPGGASGHGSVAPVLPEFTSNMASSARDFIGLASQWKASSASADAAKAQAAKAGVETDLMRKKGPEADFDKRLYNFLNGILDRFGKSSAKSSPDSLPPSGVERGLNWLRSDR